MNAQEKALALIQSIDTALAAGIEHYDIHNNPLTTTKEVIEALNRDGEIILSPPPKQTAKQIEEAKKLIIRN